MIWQDYVTIDPVIFNGIACIKGSRMMLSGVLNNLAGNLIRDASLSYSMLTPEAIQGDSAYVAEQAHKNCIQLSV
jgi:uncharacterized protein (DUF433 family)